MDFAAVFSFFSENVELTAEQRLAELICVAAVFVISAVTVAVLLTRKCKKYRAAHKRTVKKKRSS